MWKRVCLWLVAWVAIACSSPKNSRLPILGIPEYKEVNGKIDTLYHTVPNFQFVDQDSALVTEATVADKIYVADFFFGTCPTICPVMKQQMLRVYEQFKDTPNFAILSHTIDPEHDTVAYLKDYSMRLGVPDNKTWHFLTGDKDKIYQIGSGEGYMVPLGENEDAPGGFIHSGAFLLVDKERRIRGKYDGTNPKEVTALINDIPKLLAEYEQ
ncbi:SCO family protein [Roseivirga thermotolerans]|uniref:SCO family protein n=1 Tax=Roseivirga TaxID=290180 RepID=UPI0027E54123|nr:SCO family protein [Roseivirga thermotolerans]MEC7753095.1 SCO family protein [Bacteroidota bacterium]